LSGAKHCEFIALKNHFIDAYRRFLATTGINPQYIRTLRIHQGEKYINHLMLALLNEHLTNHVVCAKDEHYSVGWLYATLYPMTLRHPVGSSLFTERARCDTANLAETAIILLKFWQACACVAVCCSLLQSIAVDCSLLHCVAVAQILTRLLVRWSLAALERALLLSS